MAIKTIFFDFGGVIYKTPDPSQVARWIKLLRLADKPEIIDLLANPNESQIVQELCLGKIQEDDIWTVMADKWHIKPALIKRFRRRMFSKRRLNQPMIKLIAKLHRNYQTAILSNAGDKTRSLLEETFHLDLVVDDIIISAEEGVIKPDPKIFEIALARMHTTPSSSLFLDDYEVNVQAAREFGMQAVHFLNNEQSMPLIRQILEEEK